mmetsp:Transcript_11191/g.18813  ORF Transcript_11191/g.18813 Transcript_11191/m.18813 type:complete len:132 (-) Transcript_11191:620-1015(-)
MIDPQYDYPRMPKVMFERFKRTLLELFDERVFCNKSFCIFQNKCEELDPDELEEINLRIEIKDQYNSKTFTLDRDSLLHPRFDVATDVCAVGIYKNVDDADLNLYVGRLFIQSYYVVYDMTPFDMYKQDYI